MTRPARRRTWLGLLLVALLLPHGPGCGGERKTVARLDGPIKVNWRYTLKYQGSHGPCVIPHRREYGTLLIRRRGAKLIKHRVSCWAPRPQLAADPGKALLAYRCDEGKPWTVLHVGGAKAFIDPGADLGKGDQPRWDGAPTFAEAQLRLLQLRKGPIGSGDLFAETEARQGDVGVERLLIRAANVKMGGFRSTSRRPDLWEYRLRKLPAAAQARVQARLQERLAGTKVSHWLVRRVAALTPLGEAEVRGRLARHVRRLIDAVIADSAAWVRDDPRSDLLDSVSIALQRLALQDRPLAGELACHALKLRGRRTTTMVDALAVVAYSDVSCPEVGEIVASRRLGCWATQARCLPRGAPLEGCSPEVLAQLVIKVVQQAARRKGAYYAAPDKRDGSAMVLAAVRLHGPLPAWLTRAAERSGYRLIQRGTNSCWHKKMNKGDPCLCFWSLPGLVSEHSLPQTLCALDPGPAGGVLEHAHCTYRIDDDKKTITVLGKR